MLKTLVEWFRPPHFPDDEDRTRSALLLNVILNTFIIALPLLIVAVIVGSNTPRLTEVVVVVVVAWLTIFVTKLVMYLGQVKLAAVAAIIIIFITTTLVVYNIGTIRAPATSFYLLAIVTAGLALHRQAIVWTAGASAIVITTLLFAEKTGYLPYPDLSISITQGTTFLVAFAIISLMLFLAVQNIDESLDRVRKELADRKQAEAALKHTSAHLEILHEIDRALLTAQSLRQIADDALIRIRLLIPCPRASLTLLDTKKNEASFLSASFHEQVAFPSTPISFQEYGQRIIDKLQQNEAWKISNILEDPQATELDKGLAHEKGIHAWLSVPLLAQGQLIGALNLGRGIGESFTDDEVEIARDVADQLAIVIHQTNLNNALQKELAERKKLISQLETSNEELERFTYTVSHDLRNPLVTIKGFLGMLEKDLRENQPERIAGDFQRISNAADKMQTLLANLLELSRIGRIANPPTEVHLTEVAQEAVETLDARIRSKNIQINIASDLPTIVGDRIRLREVFENLIDNAAKYSGDQNTPCIEIGVRDDNVIYIKDNGMGIEPTYSTRIFGLFEKLNPNSEGTGIGLALVKRIIEVNGGKIWVESEGLGKGSTFCFIISDEKSENT